jgi:hypothetical protein
MTHNDQTLREAIELVWNDGYYANEPGINSKEAAKESVDVAMQAITEHVEQRIKEHDERK